MSYASEFDPKIWCMAATCEGECVRHQGSRWCRDGYVVVRWCGGASVLGRWQSDERCRLCGAVLAELERQSQDLVGGGRVQGSTMRLFRPLDLTRTAMSRCEV
jgi:hypothetical protein